MLKTKQKINLKNTLHVGDKFLCSLVRFIHGHKKACIAAKILGSLHFLLFLLGSPLNCDKEKWYHMY